MIPSQGDWDEVRQRPLSGQDRIKSDQRILGESEFVMDVLSESEERFSRRYAHKRLGYDYDKVLGKVSGLFHLEKDYITGKGRQRDRVTARDLVCDWCAAELGMSMVDGPEVRFYSRGCELRCSEKREDGKGNGLPTDAFRYLNINGPPYTQVWRYKQKPPVKWPKIALLLFS